MIYIYYDINRKKISLNIISSFSYHDFDLTGDLGWEPHSSSRGMWGTKSGQFVLQFTMCVKLMKTNAHLEMISLKFQNKDNKNNHFILIFKTKLKCFKIYF